MVYLLFNRLKIMDIAAEMILNTDEEKLYNRRKSGYLDANYFSYVSKKNLSFSFEV